MPSVIVLNKDGGMFHEGPFGKVLTVYQMGSGNSKTGNVDGLWIMPENSLETSPFIEMKAGNDVSSCGTCPHRSLASGGQGTCYTFWTVLAKGGQQMSKALNRHNRPTISLDDLTGLIKMRSKIVPMFKVRLGVYGDPAMVPAVVSAILTAKVAVLGYSHQDGGAEACMRSVDSLEEARGFWAQGVRTARVGLLETLDKANEFLCPATVEAGKKVTCQACGLCDSRKKGKSVLFPPHGLKKKTLELALSVN